MSLRVSLCFYLHYIENILISLIKILRFWKMIYPVDWGLLGSEALTIDEWFPVFRRNVVPSFLGLACSGKCQIGVDRGDMKAWSKRLVAGFDQWLIERITCLRKIWNRSPINMSSYPCRPDFSETSLRKLKSCSMSCCPMTGTSN